MTVNANSLDAYWMPFTGNRQFKAHPRMIVGADGMYFKTSDGRDLLDGIAGLWCCSAGHNRPRIVEAIRQQVGELDYAPAFQMGHPKQFELANRLTQLIPGDLNKVFFTNSGSESVETALKMAIAYHRARGEGHRTRLIGREKGYHGVNFGGMSVGGMPANRKMFGSLVSGVDHLRHTHGIAENRFSKGLPLHGAERADDLQRLCELHDPSTIAAVIVEPLAGSAGVILPPVGYLKRLREICDQHGILLIFDEVITGFGRLGAPFAVDKFGVEPDMVTTAKALTNGVIPMGAVFVQDKIYDAFMQGPENMVEFFHGYTYSGNPMACAAALGALDTYEEEGLLTRASELSDYWQVALHSLRDLPHVIDLRNMGLIAGIELEPLPGQPTKRAFDAFLKAYEAGLLIRTTGDTIALSPPLIIEKSQIDFIFDTLTNIIKTLD
ncbi:aspartate aminotransferase family protein [Paremcibacter congregatus]|uniref:Aspartate aminotransferase family protein n=1 Tax=Paremcibacter congregatus TaxID=2043170 RepID=A0A2G4YQI1_9PROT|nr:aspartate aminotransferase family protein [Paremcibacter congregatus]PHZ84547.1 aspartate aminotransferase family protein [Paremcibacter congregatus]QDE28767.1 aspartate aminotransferase family protein [Paremcibacter congregatus]